jgi:hypothetical protein
MPVVSMPMAVVIMAVVIMGVVIMGVIMFLGRAQGLAGRTKMFFRKQALLCNQPLCRSEPEQVVRCLGGALPIGRNFSRQGIHPVRPGKRPALMEMHHQSESLGFPRCGKDGALLVTRQSRYCTEIRHRPAAHGFHQAGSR